MALLAELVVALAVTWLIGLAVAIVWVPEHADRFLMGFASSLATHATEQVLRVIVGVALITHAPHMRLPGFWHLFGWVLVVSSVVLLALPWRWHQRFGELVLPWVSRHLRLYAAGSLALGGFLSWSLVG